MTNIVKADVSLDKIADNLQLTATIPEEMVTAQKSLIEWCEKKLAELNFDANELKESYEHAKKNKWRTVTLYRHYNLALKRITYYEKIKAALEAGYYVVPNFPVQMFAIRTKKESPDPMHNWHYWGDKTQNAQQLKIGEGEYQNPFPLVNRTPETIKSDTKEVVKNAESEAYAWNEFNFPITMAKPVIMQATSRAMALKIFDEFGIMPATRNEDPVIIGKINLKGPGYNWKSISFMIAWHLDTKMI